MSNIEKINSDLVEEVEEVEDDFGYGAIPQDSFKNIPELYEAYKKLKEHEKKEIDNIIGNFQISLLRSIINPKIIKIFNNLKKEEQNELNSLNLRDKYLKLNILLYYENMKISSENKDKMEEKKEEKKEEKMEEKMEEKKADSKTISQQKSLKEPPIEIFEKDIEEIEAEDEKMLKKETKTKENSLQNEFEKLIDIYYKSNPFVFNLNKNPELEVRFGTKGIKPLTKNDYDNVIKKLKSVGFSSTNENGFYSLRIQSEYLDSVTGNFNLSNIRAEINGINNIKNYCKNNDINEIVKVRGVKFQKKNLVFDNNKQRIKAINFDDFNFRVSYTNEENFDFNKGSVYYMIHNWKNSKKSFRYLNRVTFTHIDYPFNIDISIVKSSDIINGKAKTYYTTQESGIFEKLQKYEIEIEIDNNRIGPGTKFNTSKIIIESLRKVIKIILSGLQGTNYPISYLEQREIMSSYMKLIHKENYNPNKRIYPSDFIGPNSFTLQMKNIASYDENSNLVNIRKDFTVTDKADGQRHLMYISNLGKIYLINTNMDVIFTGAKTYNKELFDTLLDGELIYHDKVGKYINLYAAFDIYYLKSKDIRILPFMPLPKDDKIYESRYYLLKYFINNLKPVSILEINDNTKNANLSMKNLFSQLKKSENVISPIRIESKKFYPDNPENGDIFGACKDVLNKLHEYNTDGLIFTHAFFGVGGDAINKVGPITKSTWKYSFKWKPPQYNTIDFLVTTLKGSTGDDVVKPIFEEGINNNLTTQLSEYKIIQLRCTFNEKIHGFINPCQDIIDDKLPEYKYQEDKSDNESKPVQFYPTEPYDPEAGICNIILKKDDNGVNQMFSEENEVFIDNTIVEFRYDLSREKGWRWIPLRVRYDKTSEMMQGMKNFGNAYHVANSNWQSIHNPITVNMISTGLNIPPISVDEDIYYNKPAGKMQTESLKNFHNLYVKKNLIKSVSKKGDILIDYACGKGGDLSKWISSQLSFVFGIDISKDNLENRLDGACSRYLKARKENKNMPYALFVNGNSAYNIKNGSAMLNDKAIQVTKSIFGYGPKDEDKIGKGVARQYGVGQEGFNVSSCQFALHYFFENPETLQGFMRNLSECTKLNGYFIGTAYDGKQVFNLLKKKLPGESIEISENGKKIWEIVKSYKSDIFEDNSSSIGYKIDVYQESINQLISEYLINFDYLDRVMYNYGFKLIDRDEAQELGLPEGSGLFSELFLNMLDEISKNKYKANEYGEAPNMSTSEKKISFLNRYFVYKKIMNVNAEKVEIELGEYNQEDIKINTKETKQAVDIAVKEINRLAPKIKTLNKKLLLVPATEAIDEEKIQVTEKTKKKVKNTEKTKAKKLLIIEDDDDN
jgi:hypothetical protein